MYILYAVLIHNYCNDGSQFAHHYTGWLPTYRRKMNCCHMTAYPKLSTSLWFLGGKSELRKSFYFILFLFIFLSIFFFWYIYLAITIRSCWTLCWFHFLDVTSKMRIWSVLLTKVNFNPKLKWYIELLRRSLFYVTIYHTIQVVFFFFFFFFIRSNFSAYNILYEYVYTVEVWKCLRSKKWLDILIYIMPFYGIVCDRTCDMIIH